MTSAKRAARYLHWKTSPRVPACSSRGLRHALTTTRQTLFGRTDAYPLLCLLLNCYLYLLLLIIPVLAVLVLSSSHFTLLAFLLLLLPIIREALLLLAVTLCLLARTHFCVHIFYNLTFALERSWLHDSWSLTFSIYFFSLTNPNNINSRIRSFVYNFPCVNYFY